MPAQTYTIDIPGAADIIRIPLPEIDDVELRRQRIQRMKTHKSALPESWDWIPPAITMLDDCQDILYVGLVLSKPLLRRLPARFIPYIGWVLTANDVLNLMTMFLGMAAGGTGAKRAMSETLDLMNGGSTRIIMKAHNFFQYTNWLGFALQAGQVVQNLTGYGISLGAIMGMMSDAFWGSIRYVQGGDLTIRMPPPEDPVSKSLRYLSQSQVRKIAPDLFDPQDHIRMIAADHIAHDILYESAVSGFHPGNPEEVAQTKVPYFMPYLESSIKALGDEQIDLSQKPNHYWYPYEKQATYLEMMQTIAKNEMYYQEHIKNNTGVAPGILTAMNMVYNETGINFLTMQAEGEQPYTKLPLPQEMGMLRAIESELWPPSIAPMSSVAGWLAEAYFRHKAAEGKVSWYHALWHSGRNIYGPFWLALGYREPGAWDINKTPSKHKGTGWMWDRACIMEKLARMEANQSPGADTCLRKAFLQLQTPEQRDAYVKLVRERAAQREQWKKQGYL